MRGAQHAKKISAATLQVENLSWAPGGAANAIEDVGFELAPGQILAVVGTNGSGKTSLLRCLYRACRAQRGSVRLDGADIWSLSAAAFARRATAVPQELPSDFRFTVRETVGLARIPHQGSWPFGGDPDGDTSVQSALARMGLDAIADRIFDTLSGGEKQRVLIARALAQDPALLVLDEPTNHLDIRHQLEILSLVRTLGATVVVALHDLNLARHFADRALVLRGGRMVCEGAACDVLAPATLEAAFDVAVRVPANERLSFFLSRHPQPKELHL